jgi:hypothetical protein
MPEGFVRLSPRLEFSITCPDDGTVFPADDWAIPGSMTMATGTCLKCKTTWWTDLPYGLGFLAPTFLNAQTGKATRPHAPDWYSNRVQNGWAKRGDYPREITVEKRRELRKPCLVNCLFPFHGEAVDAILRSNQLRGSGMDVILLIPSNACWLVPDSVAEIWEVQMDAGYRNGEFGFWNNVLDRKIKELVKALPECWLPQIHQPQYLSPKELEEVTQIAPFPREKWYGELRKSPKVTFIWRTERLYPRAVDRLMPTVQKFGRKFAALRGIAEAYKQQSKTRNLLRQRDAVVAIADELHRYMPDLDFAVAGFGREVSFPGSINDLREESFSAEANHALAKRTAESHVLIGVHGSSLMPGTGLSGAVVELMPDEKLSAILTNMLVNVTDVFEAIYLYRSIPATTSPETVAQIVLNILLNYPVAHYCYNRQYYHPASSDEVATVRAAMRERTETLAKYPLLRESSLLIG